MESFHSRAEIFCKNLTKEGFEIIVNEHLAPFINNHPFTPSYLIQDNDQKHGSVFCADALAKNIYHGQNMDHF